MTFEEWLLVGITEGWVSPPVCTTHEGLPTMPEEDEAWEDGWDPCMFGLRIWEHNIPDGDEIS